MKKLGAWTDNYALGSTLYEAMSGHRVPASTTRLVALTNEESDPKRLLSDLATGYPADFVCAVDECLSLAQAKRPQTVAALQQRLMMADKIAPKVEKDLIAPDIPIVVPIKKQYWKEGVLISIMLLVGGYVYQQRQADIAEEVRLKAELVKQAQLKKAAELAKITQQTRGYQKISATGDKLSKSASQWACVLDHDTGFMWEVKTRDGGLRDRNHDYSWYNSNAQTNGGYAGSSTFDSCNRSVCNTEAYVQAVKAAGGLCGYHDWRLPSKASLLTIMDNKHQATQYIDPAYFPNMRDGYNWFWSASSYAADSERAWYVYFGNGYDYYNPKADVHQVRLVRGGQ